jgi:protein-tyrosine phosphatase/arsenate reductase
MKHIVFNPELDHYLDSIESEFAGIPENRMDTLDILGEYILKSLKNSGTAKLVFICTHNSRRSQFGQVWAAAAAEYYEIKGISTFSGGTESTAFNPGAVAALQRAGFSIENTTPGEENPKYLVKSRAGGPENLMFSKRYDDRSNPGKDFSAIMVCSDADEACPFLPGTAERISLPYDDPKTFDGTQQESVKYDERCREIARDLFYVFSRIEN